VGRGDRSSTEDRTSNVKHRITDHRPATAIFSLGAGPGGGKLDELIGACIADDQRQADEKLPRGQWERVIRGRAIPAPDHIYFGPIPLGPERMCEVASKLQACSPDRRGTFARGIADFPWRATAIAHIANANKAECDVSPRLSMPRGLRGITWSTRADPPG